MTLGEMRERMSAAELSAWIAYSRVEPIGEYRGDLRAGVIASTIANVNRGKTSRARSPKDFMPIQQDQEDKKATLNPKIMFDKMITYFKSRDKQEVDKTL